MQDISVLHGSQNLNPCADCQPYVILAAGPIHSLQKQEEEKEDTLVQSKDNFAPSSRKMQDVCLNVYKYCVQIPLHVSAAGTEGTLYAFG